VAWPKHGVSTSIAAVNRTEAANNSLPLGWLDHASRIPKRPGHRRQKAEHPLLMPVNRISTTLGELGGIASLRQLMARGFSADSIHRAQHDGRIERVRHGVYATAEAPRDVVRAARVGGALASVSTAEHHGFWVPPHDSLHVSVRPDAHYLKHPDDVGRPLVPTDHAATVLRDGHRLDPAAERFRVSRITCLTQAVRNLDEEYAIAMIDSALHGRNPKISAVEYARLQSRLPRRYAGLFAAVNRLAESGSESIARVRLARAGIIATPQVWVARGIRADLLIGDRMIIEIGSVQHHASAEAYQRDHARLAILNGLTFLVLDFSYQQVMWDWPTVLSIVQVRMDADEHLSIHR
jgi:very-short-patch-repair endonuclease